MTLSLQDFQKVLLLDRHGFFARVHESLDEFLRSGPPSFINTSSPETHPPELVSKFWLQFALDVRSVPIEISKKGVFPWEPACCWIDKKGTPMIRVRPAREHRIVSKEAILAHECVHAIRGRLFSNHFEEMCAYTVSAELFPKDFPRWRTWLSPLFSSATEVLFTFFWMIGCWTLPWIIGMGISPLIPLSVAFLPLLGYVLRLQKRWKKWHKARDLLTSINPKTALALLVRLPDEDINWLAEQNAKDLPIKLKERSTKEWRWYFFREAFLVANP